MNISAKERAGFGGFEDPKFSGEWRRQGPLPDLGSRDSSRRRFDGPPTDRQSAPPNAAAETSSDWRSSRPSRAAPPPESEAGARRKNSAFGSESGGAADKEETWTIGGKFKPTSEDEGGPGRKLGSYKARGDMGPPSSVPPDSPADTDWRTGPRPVISSRSSTSRESVILSIWNVRLPLGA
jgi:translation initiation factor 4B